MSIKFYIEEIFNLIEQNINEKNNNKKNIEGLYRHISYLIGILFQSDIENSKKYIDKSFNILNNMFNNKKIKKDGKDNIISALIRIIINMQYNKNNFKFWNDIIDKIFENFPFKYDVNENLNALNFLIYTLNIFDLNEFKKYFDKIFYICMIVIINDKKCKSTKEDFNKVKDYLKTIEKNEELKNMLQNNINNKMNKEERNKFMNILINI
jgi:DNA integrity scanning protein DisA with diadenylate cyclase activity